MTTIIYPSDGAWTGSKATANFDGAPVNICAAESLWDALAHPSHALPDNPTSTAGVTIYCRADDEGHRWYAIIGPDGARGLSSSATEARTIALRFALGGAGLFGHRVEPATGETFEDPNDEYRDPMEEPGASFCGDCGMYPLAEQEQHHCS